jgi:hexosaminidase
MSTILVFSLAVNFVILCLSVIFLFKGKRLIARMVKKIIIDTRHRQIVSMFSAMPTIDQPIIMLGDSITEGARWNELFNNPNVINRGIGGDTSSGVLKRLDEVIRHKPRKLFLMIGTNDIGFGLDTQTIVRNIESILTQVKEQSPSTEIFVQSVLPVNISASSPFLHNNKGILLLNEQIKKQCAGLNIEYIDLHLHFLDGNENLRSELTNDGLHLLGTGYLLWKELIAIYLKN